MKVSFVGSCAIGALLLLACGRSVQAEDVAVIFDHTKQSNPQEDVSAAAGDRISVTINNTCPDRFDYAQVAFERAPAAPSPPVGGAAPATCAPDKAQEALKAAGYCVMQSRVLSWVHERKNGAYAITVTKKQNPQAPIRGLQRTQFDDVVAAMTKQLKCDIPADTQQKAVVLDTPVFLVTVETSPWALGMSGGLTISDVVDPRFAVVADPASQSTPPTTIVIRDKGAEDSQALGFAGFLHVYHEKWKLLDMPIAATLGLGIAEGSSISGFVGVSAAAFDLAYLTVGWNWNSIDRLPTGQQLGAPPINDNVLNDLPSKVDDGWFIGVSFKLMSPGDSFFKSKIIATPEPKEAPAQ